MKFERLPVPPTGNFVSEVDSLTRQVKIFERTGSSPGLFYTKQDPQGKEADQLIALSNIGLSVPKKAYWVARDEALGVLDSGASFFSVAKETEKHLQQKYFSRAGELLRSVHDRINEIPKDVTSHCPNETAHPIKNFEHRFVHLQSSSVNALLSSARNDIPQELHQLVDYLFILMESYHERVFRAIDIAEDKDVAYGDFKPENILVSKEDELTLIDPELIIGHHSFDVAKFFSRAVLDQFKPRTILAFIEAYDPNFDLSKVVYGDTFTTRDIAAIDLINIFSSYIGRSLLQNSEHRLVRRMREEGRMQDLVKSLSRIATPSS